MFFTHLRVQTIPRTINGGSVIPGHVLVLLLLLLVAGVITSVYQGVPACTRCKYTAAMIQRHSEYAVCSV